MKKTRFCVNGKNVDGYSDPTWPGLVVHKAINGTNRWTVTHYWSEGMIMTGLPRRMDAVQVARLAQWIPVDWDSMFIEHELETRGLMPWGKRLRRLASELMPVPGKGKK